MKQQGLCHPEPRLRCLPVSPYCTKQQMGSSSSARSLPVRKSKMTRVTQFGTAPAATTVLTNGYHDGRFVEVMQMNVNVPSSLHGELACNRTSRNRQRTKIEEIAKSLVSA